MPPIPKKSTIFTMSELYKLDLEDLRRIAQDRKLEFKKSDDKLTLIKVILLSQRVKIKTKKIISDRVIEKVKASSSQALPSSNGSVDLTPPEPLESPKGLNVNEILECPYTLCPHCGGRVLVQSDKVIIPPRGIQKRASEMVSKMEQPLTVPQMRVLKTLSTAIRPLTIKEIMTIQGNKTKEGVWKPIGPIDPHKRKAFENHDRGGHRPSLLTLGYVTFEEYDIDGIKEVVYEITDKGRQAFSSMGDIEVPDLTRDRSNSYSQSQSEEDD